MRIAARLGPEVTNTAYTQQRSRRRAEAPPYGQPDRFVVPFSQPLLETKIVVVRTCSPLLTKEGEHGGDLGLAIPSELVQGHESAGREILIALPDGRFDFPDVA